MPSPGGVLIRSKDDNSVIGAIGVSGAVGDEDEFCAISAAAGSLFREDILFEPAKHSLNIAMIDPESRAKA